MMTMTVAVAGRQAARFVVCPALDLSLSLSLSLSPSVGRSDRIGPDSFSPSSLHCALGRSVSVSVRGFYRHSFIVDRPLPTDCSFVGSQTQQPLGTPLSGADRVDRQTDTTPRRCPVAGTRGLTQAAGERVSQSVSESVSQ
eukprot:GHVU01085201.1.p1 GENE.GHVU01085201.1~~GHVU01085201.1.p1  ORF type:complete len:141 (-),score=2.35 GHVU01085201.1:19-441(-)